jgi:N-acetyl-alpha-D-glucosaminyl L-malate synthase BshA
VGRDPGPFARPGQRILLHASNFRPVKRVSDVIRIFERVAREVDAVLLMVGEGPERAAAQALVRRLGLAERVRFLGVYESIAELVARAHVFLLPSELESFGLSALEAQACAVPVVGSDAGGLPEVVKHAETGFLLPVGDVEGMAARAIEILKDDERRREMGRAGRRRVESLFGADRVVTQYERFYEGVLNA